MYTAKDFELLRYDVINIKGPLMEAIPRLRKFKSFVDYDGEDLDKLIRLTVLFYDKGSPLVRNVRDIAIRWREAVKIAGFDLKKDSDLIQEMYDFAPRPVEWDDDGNVVKTEPCFFEDMAIEYLIDQGDLTWVQIVSNEKTFFEFQKAAQQIVVAFASDKEKLNAIAVKSKLLEDSAKIADRLDTYYTKVFGEGELNRRVRIRGFTPEMIAHGV